MLIALAHCVLHNPSRQVWIRKLLQNYLFWVLEHFSFLSYSFFLGSDQWRLFSFLLPSNVNIVKKTLFSVEIPLKIGSLFLSFYFDKQVRLIWKKKKKKGKTFSFGFLKLHSKGREIPLDHLWASEVPAAQWQKAARIRLTRKWSFDAWADASVSARCFFCVRVCVGDLACIH